MKGTLIVLLLTVFVGCIAPTVSFSKEGAVVANQENNSEKFATLGEAEQTLLAQQLVQERIDFQNNLLKQLAPETPNNVKEKIIFLLGYYRAETAVPIIAKYIDLKNEKVEIVKGGLPLISMYPAVDALIRIGTRSAPEMLKKY